jgi:capsular exopolysaccharide synthesis family protein
MHATNNTGLPPGSSKNIIPFNQLWHRYVTYWPLFVLLLAIAIAAAQFYNWYAIPTYETTAKILINDEKKGAEDSKEREVFNSLNNKKIIENEMEVVQSRTLTDVVAKKLYLNIPVLQKERFQFVSAYNTSPIKIESKDSGVITETKEIEFKVDNDRVTIINAGKQYPLNEWVVTDYGNLKFIPNDTYKKSIENSNVYYFKIVNPKIITADIQKRIQVGSSSKLSSILTLSLKDAIPQRGEDILNGLINEYNKAILVDKDELAKNTLAFVDQRLNIVTKDLNAIEQKSQQYKSGNSAIDIGTQGRLYLENVSSNDQKLSEINMQMAVLDQVQSFATSNTNKGAIVPSTLGINDGILTQLLNKLYESESEYEKLKNTEAANYPSVVALSDQITKLKPAIVQNIQSQRKSLEASKLNLLGTNNSYSRGLETIPAKEKELIEINREKGIKYSTYAFLLQKREETALAHSSSTPDNRLIDTAQSSVKPVSPNNKVVYGSCILIALLISISIITAKETFNNSVLYRQEIEAFTQKPIIGEIIYEKSKNPFVVGDDKVTFIAEQFRQLRVALAFLKKDVKKKKILVTSSIAGEGKSFISLNLALTIALTNKKVALLELDLINASISDKFNIQNNLGISDYLLGKADVKDIIMSTKTNENLFVISAGKRIKNSSELLTNGKIEDLLIKLEEDFDYIIIDTAPVNLVTDAYILSPLCDITLYAVRHNYTAKVFVQRIDSNNKINRLHNIAIVFNGIKARGFGTKGYGFGYGYGYAYNEKRPKRIRVVSTKTNELKKSVTG